MSIAFIFPGQGSQAVGMGREMADATVQARHALEEVDDALGFGLSRLMREGPAEELQLTENAQPAILAASLAALRASGLSIDKAVCVAGHSLGECTALAAAGAFDLAAAARLVRLRGRAMQAAVSVGVGAMAALIGAEWGQAEAIAAEAAGDEVCQAANDNAPGQVVISGHKAAVERAIEIAKAQGVRRALLLPVSAPFHCILMQPAAEAMQAALAETPPGRPAVPVYANVIARPVSKPDEIARLLVEQVTGAVRWRESVLAMVDAGVTHFVEWGGKVLTPMVSRISPDARATSVVSAADLDALLKDL